MRILLVFAAIVLFLHCFEGAYGETDGGAATDDVAQEVNATTVAPTNVTMADDGNSTTVADNSTTTTMIPTTTEQECNCCDRLRPFRRFRRCCRNGYDADLRCDCCPPIECSCCELPGRRQRRCCRFARRTGRDCDCCSDAEGRGEDDEDEEDED